MCVYVELKKYQKRKANWKGHVSCARFRIMYSCLCALSQKPRSAEERATYTSSSYQKKARC